MILDLDLIQIDLVKGRSIDYIITIDLIHSSVFGRYIFKGTEFLTDPLHTGFGKYNTKKNQVPMQLWEIQSPMHRVCYIHSIRLAKNFPKSNLVPIQHPNMYPYSVMPSLNFSREL